MQQTLGDLLAIDEPLSAEAVAANEIWLRTPHPEHFHKDTDRLGSAAESDGGRMRRSSGSSCRTSTSSTTNNNSSSNASGGLNKENAGGFRGEDRRGGGGQGLANVVSGSAGVENGTRTRPMKRPRENGGVLVSLSWRGSSELNTTVVASHVSGCGVFCLCGTRTRGVFCEHLHIFYVLFLTGCGKG